MNRYAFTYNNPIMGIDPSGYDTDEALYNAWEDSKIKYKSILREIEGLENNIMKYGGSNRKFRKRDNLYEQLEKALVAREKARRDYFGSMGDGTSSADDNYYDFTITLAKATYPGYIATNPNMCGDHHEYSLFKNQAGYWGGKFVNDGGASEMDKLRDAGVPESVIVTIWRSSFVAMSDKEVMFRNNVLDRALAYMDESFTVDGVTYNGVRYSQGSRGSLEQIRSGETIGADCSSLVSEAWGLKNEKDEFQMTTTLEIDDIVFKGYDEKADYGIYNGRIVTVGNDGTDFAQLAPGDAVLKYGEKKGEDGKTIYKRDKDEKIVYKDGKPVPEMENHIRLVLKNEGGLITFIEQTTNPTEGRPGRTDIKTMGSDILAKGDNGVPYIGVRFIPN